MKGILRIGALLLLAAMLLCGCNAVDETTEGTTKGTSATSATSGTTATTQQTSGSTDDQGGQENNNKPTVVRKKVALTFDDGPDDQNTKILIDELKKYGLCDCVDVVVAQPDTELEI